MQASNTAVALSPLILRAEEENDREAVNAIHRSAFNKASEANLVVALRQQVDFNPLLSRVAVQDNTIVGHVLLTELKVDSDVCTPIVALAPMAVLPEYQGQGVGGALIDDSFNILQQQGYVGVLVLGDNYYQRFGFAHDKVMRIESEYQGLHYMGYEFVAGVLSKVKAVHYPQPFAALNE
jgi:putative acetyltransferase